jgi:hypothetical protein
MEPDRNSGFRLISRISRRPFIQASAIHPPVRRKPVVVAPYPFGATLRAIAENW